MVLETYRRWLVVAEEGSHVLESLPSKTEPHRKGGCCTDESSSLHPILHVRSRRLASTRILSQVSKR